MAADSLHASGAARVRETPAAMLSLCPVLTGADPSPPGQSQEQTPVSGPLTQVGVKAHLSPRGHATKEELKSLLAAAQTMN